MTDVEKAREEFKKQLNQYTVQNLISLMQVSDVTDPGHQLNRALSEIEHSKMIYSVCEEELRKRLQIKKAG